MPLTRRFVLPALSLAIAAIALAGCSSAAGLDPTVAAAATAVGHGAVSASAAPTGTAAPAWHDTIGCPASFTKGFLSGIQRTAPQATVKEASTSSIHGPAAAPDLNKGMPASCAFLITVGGRTSVDEVFVGMPQSGMTDLESKLTAAGFVTSYAVGAPTAVYTKGGSSVVLQFVSQQGLSVLSVVG